MYFKYFTIKTQKMIAMKKNIDNKYILLNKILLLSILFCIECHSFAMHKYLNNLIILNHLQLILREIY